MDRNNTNEIEKLIVDLAVRSYQIFLVALVVNPWVIGRFDLLIFSTGFTLALICIIIAYYSASKLGKRSD